MRHFLSSRERLLRVFRQQDVDRMPVRLCGVDPLFPSDNASWKPLYALVEEHQLDVISEWSPEVHEAPAVFHAERQASPRPDLWEALDRMETPQGMLTQVRYVPKDGRPGYVKKHFIETVAEAKAWLSLPRARQARDAHSYGDLQRRAKERAMLMVEVGEAMYSVQALMGSETFGFWLMEERALLHEMIDRAYADVERDVKQLLAADVGDCYGWVGPELCIPPLASPRDFREFVFDYDRRIVDLVHDAGKVTWIHCHGDMHPVLEQFVEMGLNCLNPIEPPPTGKLTLAEAKARADGRMTLDGGVQNGDFDLLTPDQMSETVEQVIAQGKPGGCFILCPTSTPTIWPMLNGRHIENFRVFVETATQLGDY